MRELLTQSLVAFILISLAVELLGWAVQYCFGEAWWQRLLPQRGESADAQERLQLQPALAELPGEETSR